MGGYFIKEGVVQDYEVQEPLLKLLYFESSKTLNKELSSFDEYISRCPPEQKEIYYLGTASREIGFQSPYFEAFEKAGREVIFVYSAIDEYVLTNVDKYEGRRIVSIEKGDIDLGNKDEEKKKDDKKVDDTNDDSDKNPLKLSELQVAEFFDWFKNQLPEKIEACKSTTRLSKTP